jgi:hypothetical protein
MKICAVALLAAAVALTGCGTHSVSVDGPAASVSSSAVVDTGRVNYDVGLFSVPAAVDAQPKFSLTQVEDYLTRRPGRNGAETPGKPEVELRQVTQNDKSSLQWVIVWHHSKLTSRGPADSYPDDALANCDMILMLDAETGGFTLQVQLCAPPPAGQALIDAGKMAPPLYTVAP